jgi:hypothetical protein
MIVTVSIYVELLYGGTILLRSYDMKKAPGSFAALAVFALVIAGTPAFNSCSSPSGSGTTKHEANIVITLNDYEFR